MVTRDAKEYPETISGEIQGGRPLHFLRLLSRIPLLEYGTMISYEYSCTIARGLATAPRRVVIDIGPDSHHAQARTPSLPRMSYAESVADLIGKTPVRQHRLASLLRRTARCSVHSTVRPRPRR
jgi:hypothetical protein